MSNNSFNITIKKHNRLLVSIKDFDYKENHINFLFGESGIGKSLIAKTIYGILDPGEFGVKINNEIYDKYLSSETLKELRVNSHFVFQEPSSHLNPLIKLGEQLRESSYSKKVDVNRILERLWDTADTEILKIILSVFPKPYRPSGGEKQRILLAMAFLKIELFINSISDKNKTLFVFDEPSGSLDNHFRNMFLLYLFECFQKKKFTVLLITHDYSMINAIKDIGKDILANVSYAELSLYRGELRQKNFNPSRYLNWLNNVNTTDRQVDLFNRVKPLLKIENGIEVIDRKLIISKNPDGSDQCPLEIFPYSIIYLKARSGIGKTTFAKTIMGLMQAKNLQITLKNIRITERTTKKLWRKYIWGRQMAITFQHSDEALNPDSSVIGTLYGLPQRQTKEQLIEMMNDLFEINIDDKFLKKKVKYLSGGQKQKLNLMRSLILDTDILILDEPFNGLDFESITKVLVMIQEKQKAGKGILLISHNEEIFDAVIPREHIYYLRSYQN